jgi:protein-tyrosine phosphatase
MIKNDDKNNENLSQQPKGVSKTNINKNLHKTVKCPKCSQEIKNNKLKEHLQSSHITEIINNIFIGSYLNAKNWNELEKNNIKYILNCATECKNIFEDKIKYLKLDIKDQNDFPIQDFFDKGIQFIQESVNNNDGNILIHCMEGKSRSTTLLMAYLIKYKNENTNSAYKIVKSKRQLTMPNLGFMFKLREYEKSLINS